MTMPFSEPTLHSALVKSQSPPQRWILVLHGILGSSANWMTFAKRYVQARPSCGVILADIRMHGRSQGFSGPHTVDACASDLLQLLKQKGLEIHEVSGHSFGSKVATKLGEKLAAEGQALDRLWLLDADPGSVNPKSGRSDPSSRDATASSEDSDDVDHVLRVLSRGEESYPSRAMFLSESIGQGLSRPVADWLSMNLRRDDDQRLRLRLDLCAIKELLADYRRWDAWPAIEYSNSEFVFVVGGSSPVVGVQAQTKMQNLAASESERVSFECIRGAEHWLHVSHLECLLQLYLNR